MTFFELTKETWPWYIAGTLIGLMIPLLLLTDNKHLGISSTMRDFCAFVLPKPSGYFKYNLKEHAWRNIFVLGVLAGGAISALIHSDKSIYAVSDKTVADLSELGLTDFSGLVPKEIFNWSMLLSIKGLLFIVLGGFLVGFGTRYANGCTSGHTIMGLSLLSPASIIATLGFFAGGLFTTHILFPIIL
ncbi:MAG: YeeE/YedE family protein [Bacteroidales bacterium]|nr:YeeE/YedE family protein [Bacteroidales bacterium]